MKKLVFLFLLFGFIAKAEQQCILEILPTQLVEGRMYIKENCEKGDILSVNSLRGAQGKDLSMYLVDYCRFDREIVFRQTIIALDLQFLSCVLNSNEPRLKREG